jgi:DNA-binding MarR family transcriptional regulator
VARAVERLADEFERRLEARATLSPRLVRVLERLDRDGPATTSELAGAEGVRHQSMAATISDLGTLGFVTRRPHPDDVRKLLVEITEDGRDGLGEQRRARINWLVAAIDRELSESDRALAATALIAVLEAIAAVGE